MTGRTRLSCDLDFARNIFERFADAERPLFGAIVADCYFVGVRVGGVFFYEPQNPPIGIVRGLANYMNASNYLPTIP